MITLHVCFKTPSTVTNSNALRKQILKIATQGVLFIPAVDHYWFIVSER